MPVENFDDGARGWTADRIINRLAFAARADDPVFAQQRQMLGHCRVADAERPGQLAHRALAVDQLTNEQQTVPIGERLQELACPVRRRFHLFRFYIHTCVSTH